MIKQGGGKVAVYVVDYDSTNDVFMGGVTGQAGNLTATIAKDGAGFSGIGNAFVELDATDAPGVYIIDLDAGVAEDTDANNITIKTVISGSSYTVIPEIVTITTQPDWDEIKGVDYSSATDTLEKIGDYFATSISAVLQRGLVTQELSGVGWLSEISEKARRWVDESALSAKFQSSDILSLAQEGIRELYTELLAHDGTIPLVRYNLAIVADQDEYVLPPQVGRVIAFAYIDSDSQRPTFYLMGSHPTDPTPVGFDIEGTILRITNRIRWFDGETLQLLYLPNGDFKPIVGQVQDASTALDADDDAITIAASEVLDGEVDWRVNAYAGYVFRHVPMTTATNGPSYTDAAATYVTEDIPIASSSLDPANSKFTINLRRPLSYGPASGSMGFEVVPIYWKLFEDVLAVHIARSIVMTGESKRKYDLITQKYREKLRALRLQVSKLDQTTAGRFDNRHPWNEDIIGIGNWNWT